MKKVMFIGLLCFSSVLLAACSDSSNKGSADDAKGSSTKYTSVKKIEKTNFSESENSSLDSSTSESSEENSNKENLLKNDPTFGELTTYTEDGEKITVENKKEYSSDYSDNSWSGLNVSIDKVAVYKTSEIKTYSNDTYNGFVAVHFNVDNQERDLNFYPTQAKIVTDYGEQVEDGGVFNFDTWDGELMKGSKKDGWGIYPLAQLTNADELKSLRININGHYDTDDYDDENSHHDYDISLQLQ